jgi:alkylhydroperoxidase family enzyme
MSRLTPPALWQLPPAARQILARDTDQFGAPLNTSTVVAHHPALLEAFKGWYAAMNAAATKIPATLKYLVYVRVASLNGCPF